MKQQALRFLCVTGAAALIVGGLATGTAAAGAAGYVCSGTPKAPGVLTGNYAGNVSVNGACAVNMGTAVVAGNLTIDDSSVLIASFAMNDGTGTGVSNITVKGDVNIEHAATLLLGCDPQGFACLDDPNQTNPTLSSHSEVWGSIIGEQALGLIAHNDTVDHAIQLNGGGRGVNCNPVGIFRSFKSPVFTAIEDSNVGGNVRVYGYQSCWLGVASMQIGGDLVIDNSHLADPDAIEILSNHVSGELDCQGNSMVWDSAEARQNHVFPRIPQPNTVLGGREDRCRLSSPTKPGGPLGPGAF
jgi:hypothetical protein